MKKFLIMTILGITLMQPILVNKVMADEIVMEQTEIQNGSFKEARKDTIEIKYRTYNGIKQYRKWNVTRKCWVDSNWINFK